MSDIYDALVIVVMIVDVKRHKPLVCSFTMQMDLHTSPQVVQGLPLEVLQLP